TQSQATVKGRILQSRSHVPLAHVGITIKDSTGAVAYTQTGDKDEKGDYTATILSPGPGLFTLETTYDKFVTYHRTVPGLTAGATLILPDMYLAPTERNCCGELTRTVIGFEQAGGSASASQQKFFFDLFVSVPFKLNRQKDPKANDRREKDQDRAEQIAN